jgi:hypothetical protein
MLDDADINKTITGTSTTDENYYRGNLAGTYESKTQILSAQVNWKF